MDADIPSWHGQPTPPPNTVHPFYEGYASHIRLKGRVRAKVQMVEPIVPTLAGQSVPGEEKPERHTSILTIHLHRKTAWGPAPFIGDPLMIKGGYFWDYWIDAEGRWIAGDSKLEWAPCYKGEVM
jgi:hypothetical protein